MSIKQTIINLFPSLYIQKNFTFLKTSNFSNYREKNIEPELLLLKHLIKSDEMFVDVGSNKGLFLFSALQFLNPAQIIGFEPNPFLLKKIKAVFKKVKIFGCALSDNNSQSFLTIPFTKNQPDDSLGTINSNAVSENAFNFKVEVKTLDDCAKEFSSQTIGLIKIDVEGNELKVLAGAEKTILKNQSNLIVEIEQRHHSEEIKFIIFNLMDKFKSKAFYFLPSQNKLIDFSISPDIYQSSKDFGSIDYVNNFIFVPISKSPELLISKINLIIESGSRK